MSYNSKKMGYIGQDLKKERELKGISLEEIAESTKINIRFLRALEEDQLDILPGKFLTKSIMRTYVQYLGIENKQILDRLYQEASLQDKVREITLPSLPTHKELSTRAKNLIRSLVILFSFIIIVFGLFLVFKNDAGEKTPIPPPVQKSIPEADEKPAASPVKPEPKPQELSFKFNFQQTTWIQIYADEELVLSREMRTGEEFLVVAYESLLLNVGNAGGFSYTINNKPGKALGEPGRVVNSVQINLDNYQQYIQDNQPNE